MGEREMFYLMTHSTHFIYGYMASDIWLRTILIVRKETRCRHIGYSYRLAARVLLYAPSHRQDSTHHRLCYTSRGALAGTRNATVYRELSYTVWTVYTSVQLQYIIQSISPLIFTDIILHLLICYQGTVCSVLHCDVLHRQWRSKVPKSGGHTDTWFMYLR